MEIIAREIHFSTQGNSEIVDLTNLVQDHLKNTGLSVGLVNVFVPGATGGITTIEFEPGLVDDLKQSLQQIVPEQARYSHNLTHQDRNGHSHIRASLMGPSLSIPFESNTLQLGKWQQIIFVDFDNRPRNRNVKLQIIGKK